VPGARPAAAAVYGTPAVAEPVPVATLVDDSDAPVRVSVDPEASARMSAAVGEAPATVGTTTHEIVLSSLRAIVTSMES